MQDQFDDMVRGGCRQAAVGWGGGLEAAGWGEGWVGGCLGGGGEGGRGGASQQASTREVKQSSNRVRGET